MGKGRDRRKRHQKKLRRHDEKMAEQGQVITSESAAALQPGETFELRRASVRPFTAETVKEALKKSAPGANELKKDLDRAMTPRAESLSLVLR